MKNVGLGDVEAGGGGRPQANCSPRVHYILCLLACTIAAACVFAGCGEEASSGDAGAQTVVEESGSIDPGDTEDPNYGGQLYDAYMFEAKQYDRVRVEVTTESFVPLLLLVEVSTGAQLWEWQEEYSDEDALNYTIAGPGSYEARVYALEGGMGPYQIRVTLNN